jgi:hypothetical protein
MRTRGGTHREGAEGKGKVSEGRSKGKKGRGKGKGRVSSSNGYSTSEEEEIDKKDRRGHKKGEILITGRTRVDKVVRLTEPLARYPVTSPGERTAYLFDLGDYGPTTSKPGLKMDQVLRSEVCPISEPSSHCPTSMTY